MPLILDSRRKFTSLEEASDFILKLSDNFNALYSQLTTIQYSEPPKPRTGDFAVADGTSWNPGSGAGLYRRNAAGAWEKL